MTQQIPATSVFALLMDGAQVEIRQPTLDDHDAVRALHESLSDESHYLRFFAFNRRMAERVAERVCREPAPDHGALGAWLGDRLVGVAEYEAYREYGAAEIAEVAMAVADDMHHRGVGTLLLEHLASLARSRGIRSFRADTLAENTPMLRVFADAGLPVKQRFANGVMDVTMPLDLGDHYLDVVTERERHADVTSLEPLLRPGSVAVVGAGRGASSPGGAIVRSLSSSGFTGALYAVNPHAAGRDLHGVRCYESIAELPQVPELAVIAVPAAAVPQAAADCARQGVAALVVITSGLTVDQGGELMAVSHRHGMRVVGPNCLGIVNTETGLDASFAAGHPRPGAAGVVVQSGGVGIGLLEHLSRLGIGVSSFASVGDKYDVSANDMLMWWEADAATRLGIVHVESFGNPRKFARTARRVGRGMPLLTVIAGRSAPGARAAASHTAAALTSEVVRRALFTQAGIVATDSLGDLVDVAALLAGQPCPEGPRVAIISNAGGAGVLAADACVDAGLSVPDLDPVIREKLASLLPECAAVTNPVDTTAAIGAGLFREAIDLVAAGQNIDAVLAVVAPTALGDLHVTAPGSGKPAVGVVLGQAETVEVGDGGVPSYAFPENAGRALAHAWSYGRWRARPAGQPPALDGMRPAEVRSIIDSSLKAVPDGCWLPPRETLRLLEAYGLPLVPWRWADSMEGAVSMASDLGGRVALKAQVPGVVHKSAAGALQLDLRGPAEVRRAYRWLKRRFGDSLQGVLVQAMGEAGVEVLCGAVQDDVFGPVVVFGTGGVDTDAAGDRAARLAPLTEADADELIDEVRAAALLRGHPGRRPGDLDGLRDALTRLSQLVHDHPEIAELDLNPMIVRPEGVQAVDARMRLAPRRSWDPYLRRLR